MTNPLVTCVIPCFNRPDYVRVAIDSVLAQTYQPIEIIVVDDGSTDDTPQVLATYGDRICVIRQENAGTAAARNTGIAASHGNYLAWLDSDDAWLPNKIAAQVQVAEEHPEAAVVYTTCQAVDSGGNPPPPVETIAVPPAVLRDDIMRMMVVESEVMPSSCLVRRDALDAVGWFRADYLAEDWELHFRLARRFKFMQIDAPLTRYRVHESAKSKDRWPHAQGLLKLRREIEAARSDVLREDPSAAMRAAYDRHRIKFAEAFYRVGKLALDRGDVGLSRRSLREAIRRNPRVLKYYTRSLSAWTAGFFRRREEA